MTTHRPGTVPSPRRREGLWTPQRDVLYVGSTCAAPAGFHRTPSIPRGRPRSSISSGALVLEGLLSATCCLKAWDGATLVVAGIEPREGDHLDRALGSAAFFAVVAPLLVLAVRGAMIALGKGRGPLSLGFALPPTVDEHAVLDLYVMGLMACAFGVVVPALEWFGYCLGKALSGLSAVWALLAFVAVVPLAYVAAGACIRELAPADGFIVNTRPRKAMWALSGAGHAAILWSCFYSPEVRGPVGFFLGLVHTARLVGVALSFPGSCDDIMVADSDTACTGSEGV